MDSRARTDEQARGVVESLSGAEVSDSEARQRLLVLAVSSQSFYDVARRVAPPYPVPSVSMVEECALVAERLVTNKIFDPSYFDPQRIAEASFSGWIYKTVWAMRVRVRRDAARRIRDYPAGGFDAVGALSSGAEVSADGSRELLFTLCDWVDQARSAARDERVRTARSAAAVRLALGFSKPIRPRFDELDVVADCDELIGTTIAYRSEGSPGGWRSVVAAIFDDYSDEQLFRLYEHDARIGALIVEDAVRVYTRPNVRAVEKVVRRFSDQGAASVLAAAARTWFAFECESSYRRLPADVLSREAEVAADLRRDATSVYRRAADELGLADVYAVHSLIAEYAEPIIRELHNEPDRLQEQIYV